MMFFYNSRQLKSAIFNFYLGAWYEQCSCASPNQYGLEVCAWNRQDKVWVVFCGYHPRIRSCKISSEEGCRQCRCSCIIPSDEHTWDKRCKVSICKFPIWNDNIWMCSKGWSKRYLIRNCNTLEIFINRFLYALLRQIISLKT